MKLGGSLIETIEAGKVERVPHEERDPGLGHLAISVADIHKAYEHLTRKAVTCKSEPKDKEGIWTTFLEDPEHNLLHLIQRSSPCSSPAHRLIVKSRGSPRGNPRL